MPIVSLYCFSGSHPCITVQLALRHAGIEHEERVLLPGLHAAWLRARGFQRMTVPAAIINGERVQGSRQICRAIARLAPEAKLLPDDANERAEVLAAEHLGERLQIAARRLIYVLAQDDPSLIRELTNATFRRLPSPAKAVVTKLLIAAAVKGHGAHADRVDHELMKVSEALDTFDELLQRGVLGGEHPNVADLQIAPTLTLLCEIPELAQSIKARPCWRISERLLPSYPLSAQVHAPTAWGDRLAAR